MRRRERKKSKEEIENLKKLKSILKNQTKNKIFRDKRSRTYKTDENGTITRVSIGEINERILDS